MRLTRFNWIAAIPLLVLIAVAGCKSSAPPTTAELQAQWAQRVHATIADSARVSAITNLGNRMIDRQRQLDAEVAALDGELRALNLKSSTTTEELNAAVAKFEDARRKALADYREAVFDLRRTTNAKEWKELNK